VRRALAMALHPAGGMIALIIRRSGAARLWLPVGSGLHATQTASGTSGHCTSEIPHGTATHATRLAAAIGAAMTAAASLAPARGPVATHHPAAGRWDHGRPHPWWWYSTVSASGSLNDGGTERQCAWIPTGRPVPGDAVP